MRQKQQCNWSRNDCIAGAAFGQTPWFWSVAMPEMAKGKTWSLSRQAVAHEFMQKEANLKWLTLCNDDAH
eukprot:5937840-Ditylum_brightwellii.AAC.1